MGHIVKVGPKKYRIVYDISQKNEPRKQKTETLRNVTAKEAKAAMAKREEFVTKDMYAKDAVTVAEVFEKFFARKQADVDSPEYRFSAKTLEDYRSKYNLYLEPVFGSKKISELNKLHIVETLNGWCRRSPSGRKVGASTILHVKNLIRSALSWAVTHDLATDNIIKRLDTRDLPRGKKPRIVALDELELRKILAEARNPTNRAKKRGTLSAMPWFYPAIYFAAYTGARRGEVLAMRWSRINFSESSVTVSEALGQTAAGIRFKETKTYETRTIKVDSSVISVLKTLKASQAQDKLALGDGYKDADLVFAMADGRPVIPWNFGAAFTDLIERLDVTRITLHGLRDTHASLLAKAGTAIEVISKRLGHSNIQTTMDRYMHIYKERDTDAVARFEGLMTG